MCEGVVENTAERKCFKNTLIAIDKSIDKGNDIIDKLIKKLKENEPKRKI